MKKFQSIYYNQSKKIYINCRIEDHEIFNASKLLKSKHINYIITINTFYKNWTIKKRYSEFEELHNGLSTKITNLPDFPQKRIFSLSSNTINERKIAFEFYLNFLFKNVNICVYPEILDFIELEKDLLNLFMINNSVIENTSNSAIKRNIIMRAKSSSQEKTLKTLKCRSHGVEGNQDDINYFNSFLDYQFKLSSDKRDKNSKSANMLVIEEFLRNLQFKYENKIDIIKTFEQFLKSKKNWPTFKLDELSKLFYGDLVTDDHHSHSIIANSNSNGISNNVANNNNVLSNNNTNNKYGSNIHGMSNLNKSFILTADARDYSSSLNDRAETPLKGLIYHIGSRKENLLGSEACLEFLSKLINFEFNPECEAYIYMLKITKIDQLNNMRLLDHINSGKHNIIMNAFSILKAILLEDKQYLIKLKKLINDENIINKFILWYQINSV